MKRLVRIWMAEVYRVVEQIQLSDIDSWALWKKKSGRRSLWQGVGNLDRIILSDSTKQIME